MPLVAYSSAADFVRPITPCFEATYADAPGNPFRPPADDVCGIREVGGPEQRLRTGRGDFFRDRCAALDVHIRNDDVHAATCERQGGRAADAGAAAGHDHDSLIHLGHPALQP